jgi:hypothetical protein
MKVLKKSYQVKSGREWIHSTLLQTFKNHFQSFSSSPKQLKWEGQFQSHKASIIPIAKQDKDNTIKENYRPISL